MHRGADVRAGFAGAGAGAMLQVAWGEDSCAATVVAELEVGPGPEWGSIGKCLLHGVQALLFVRELRVGDRDPAAVLHR
jgi:hypothetical protein